MNSPGKILGDAKIGASRLFASYPEREAHSLARILAVWVTGTPWHTLLTQTDRSFSPAEALLWENSLRRLLAGEPVQYITGEARFCDWTFRIRPGALIPRPETEELVHWVVESLRTLPSPKILDIGTGSGCIAVSLSLYIGEAQVSGVDISPEAISIAVQNNDLLGATVKFTELDILTPPEVSNISNKNIFQNLDAIVSNPPYIKVSEKEAMHPNVVSWEPHTALFVPEDDALLFYRQICRIAGTALNPGGYLFFEIHESLGAEVLDLMRGSGFREVTLRQDIHGKDRMVRGIW